MKKITLHEVLTSIVVGISATLINLIASYVMYVLLEVGENATTLLAWFIAAIVACLMNYKWVFKNKETESRRFWKKVLKFFSVRIVSYLIEALWIFVFITLCGYTYWIFKLTISVIVLVINFLCNKYLIFVRM